MVVVRAPQARARSFALSGSGYAAQRAEGLIQFAPQRILGNEVGDGLLQIVDLPLYQLQQFVEVALHGRVGDEPLLIALRGAYSGELAQARHQRAQMLLRGRGQRHRGGALDFGVPGDDPGIYLVSFFQPPHTLGKAPHRTRIEDGNAPALGR